MLIDYSTVTSTRAKWKSLRDGFQRRVKKNPNADYRGNPLSFLLKNNEENIKSELPVSSEIASAGVSQNSIVIGTENVSAPSNCFCVKNEEDLNLFFRGVASSMRNFTRSQVAHIKFEINNLVGRVEIENSKQEHDRVLLAFQPATEVTYVLNPMTQNDSNENYVSTSMNTMPTKTGHTQ